MPEEKGKEKKEEGKIVLEAKMHCGDCRYEVYRTLIDYPGVEDVSINFAENKINLKAPNVDAKKLFESVKKKRKGRITKLVYPDPSSLEKKKEEPKKEEKKPVEATVVLKTSINCSSCKQKMEKAAWKIDGVQSIKVEGETLTIKGLDLDAAKVCEEFIKKTRKFAEVVPPKKKEGEKKSNEQKDDNAKKDEKQTPIIITKVYAPPYFTEENPNDCSVM